MDLYDYKYNGFTFKAKKIIIPINLIINYKYKWADCVVNFESGVFSHTPDEPITVAYIDRLNKYLVQDGNHRLIQKAIENYITEIECFVIDIKDEYPSQTSEFWMNIFKDVEHQLITVVDFVNNKSEIVEYYKEQTKNLW